MVADEFLADAIRQFHGQKRLVESAIAQIPEEALFTRLDPEGNSIAIVMKHMAGNMRSRWTDFLTSDGEKPERNRDLEFVMLPETTRQDMLAYWEKGWRCTFDAIEPLIPEDLMRTVTIRGQEHTVVQAINRQLAHYAYHVGQIVYLAKHFKSSEWQSLSVPKNKSAEFNSYLEEKIRAGELTSRERRLDEVIDFARSKAE
jgi:Protein of unknown function (DUF1572)